MSSSLGVILAGGLATRMGGGDKGVLPLGSSTLLSHVIDRLTPQVDGIALNVNGDGSRFSHLGFPLLDFGPSHCVKICVRPYWVECVKLCNGLTVMMGGWPCYLLIR